MYHFIEDIYKKPVFPDSLEPDKQGLIAVGGELTTEVLVEAYSKGIFPWYEEPPVLWFSPDPRFIMRPADFHLSKSLKRVIEKNIFTVHFDEDFEGVIRACAAMTRDGQAGTWINDEMITAYLELADQHVAHAVSVRQDGELVGGLYGVCLGRSFFGESMFHHRTDASKVAFHGLCGRLKEWDFDVIDCQQQTPHLASLGAYAIPRQEFLGIIGPSVKRDSVQHKW